ncbi:helix-turn-helix domain-containing protein [Jiulongibacter sediminis]|uniref:XRE family transcriptional regulator n=1 Tax=Jiulongibacter sediminis TaxID=1605367 RepID=A0A0P7C125_9BACT|nr:helix-turn-helix transcriptional regulator [Jiulongibacter sediminis]KPM46992.1 XRE family transcriptional regulator [Jiulongibacter sediminis]TBX22334.1 XRE family transcriptional regulator [Jiulongibacter sediminis]
MKNEHIRLIFGLKLKQIRQEKNLSLQALSKVSGISQSYLNEIEKGKKYPKTDKISALAAALEVEYDTLVSLKLSKKLEPMAKLLKSNMLTEIPFDFFGLDTAQILDLFSAAPAKLSAFVNAIFEIGKNYNLTVEKFYFAALRSYQEMHQNYFPEIEEEAVRFLKDQVKGSEETLNENILAGILKSMYGIEISYFDEEDQPIIANMRSVFRPESKILMINKRISEDQRAFTMAKELGFQYMGLKERPFTSSSIEVQSFEEVLNNFKASYFAGAILIRQELIIEALKDWFAQKTWKPEVVTEMAERFHATPETLFHRISNVLPKHFGIDKFLFMRFDALPGSQQYFLTKEMHLSKRLGPQENKEEHYCRRWVSIEILDHLSSKQEAGKYTGPIVDGQFSYLKNRKHDFFVLAMARPLNIKRQLNISVSLGFEVNDQLKSKIKFLNDKQIDKREVNQTCERCGIFDCKERVAAPTILQKKRHQEEIRKVLERLN